MNPIKYDPMHQTAIQFNPPKTQQLNLSQRGLFTRGKIASLGLYCPENSPVLLWNCIQIVQTNRAGPIKIPWPTNLAHQPHSLLFLTRLLLGPRMPREPPQPLELHCHLLHRRSILRAQPQAPHHELGGRLQLLERAFSHDPRLEHLEESVLLHGHDEVGREVPLLLGSAHIDGLSAREELGQHDPEAVDVALLGELARPEVFWVEVAERALDQSRDLRLVQVDESGGPEIGYFGRIVLVEKDVGRLHVPPGSWSRAVDLLIERTVRDEFVHEQRHLGFQAAPEEFDHVPVVDLGEYHDFVDELFDLALVHYLRLLDGHHALVSENTFIHRTVATAA
ncbi:anthranilate synthase alpha subunit 1 [Striga asiatica]|uniref:Anthranilate synthase alpha subunit 1 n=1 Tax=Striga asiatica TaxID=4170 RepID=A0A5A7RAE0_STRAF|nr:anthranilate synthase alpha subunit 1 [Striga asiatica]